MITQFQKNDKIKRFILYDVLSLSDTERVSHVQKRASDYDSICNKISILFSEFLELKCFSYKSSFFDQLFINQSSRSYLRKLNFST